MEYSPSLEIEGSLETGCLVSTKSSHPSVKDEAAWVQAIRSKDAVPSMPQTIAHRGYSSKFPENSMNAFKHAIDVGANAIETDVHLSRDGVVVLCHDSTLKRCFGVDKRVVDCDWKYLSTLRTLKEPHEPLPRLVDLLKYIASPERAHVWILLDIKVDNNTHNVIAGLADALASVPSPNRPWDERVVLGCWTAEYLSLVRDHFPTYPLAITTFSIQYARQFLRVPGVSISINQKVLMGCGGRKFLAQAKRAGKAVFVWTVNHKALMWWSIRHQVDGVITDRPAVFGEIGKELEDDDYGDGFLGNEEAMGMEQRMAAMVATVASWVLGVLLMVMHPVKRTGLDGVDEETIPYA
ncbi:hypothetical protein LOZ53_005775 [Ophidiomyces ophidiicola]|nr:hypothetical protein LOZ54_005705 [Ophidiomyces ophidiicola]KAI1981568.1 hypothetical protein LOZ55_000590 [Ophidiomyces ophidiicola]KAI1983649.1 hypothetical protein LOZ53_005775 [Ophidiomyces ophidiicola]KAI1989362.1 hypothetical protein LOZ51_005174 [Ophidiomyces ophidiicola]